MADKRKALVLAICTTLLIWLVAFAIAHMTPTPTPTNLPIPWFWRDLLLSLLGLKVFKVLVALASASFLGASLLTWLTADQIFAKMLAEKHSQLVENGDLLLGKGDFPGALNFYLKATRFNEKYLHDGHLRLSDLFKLGNLYKQSDDEPSYLDVQNRIKAIEAEHERMRLAVNEPWIKALRPKLKYNLAVLASSVLAYIAIIVTAGFFWPQIISACLIVATSCAFTGSLLALILNVACRIDSVSSLLSTAFNRFFLDKKVDQAARKA